MASAIIFIAVLLVITTVGAVTFAFGNSGWFADEKDPVRAHLYNCIELTCVYWWLGFTTIVETASEIQRIVTTSNWSVIGTKLIWVVPVWLMATAFFKGEKYKNEKAVKFSYLMAIGFGLVVVAEAIYSVIVYLAA